MTLYIVMRLSCLRCLAMYSKSFTSFTITCHICAIINGLSNIVVGSAPLAISSAWFSPGERVTATTIAQVRRDNFYSSSPHFFCCESNSRNNRPWSLSQSVTIFNISH